MIFYPFTYPVDTGRKLNAHKTFRRRPGGLLIVLCTFNLRCVSTGQTSSVTGTNISQPIQKLHRALSQYLWFNKLIIVDNSYVSFTNFSSKNINFLSDLVNENCDFKSWETLISFR